MTARDVLARLQRHYIKPGEALPGGVFLPEVTMGRAGGSRADALYVGFTTTTGRILVGHEVKVSRADWRNELANPGKADPWADQCHAWYVVAPSTDVVPAEELPPGWGLLTCDGPSKTRLRVVVKATVHQDRQPSWHAALSILSRADMLRANAVVDARAKARDEARAEVAARVAAEVEARRQQEPDAQAAWDQLRALTDALGLRIVDGSRSWSYRDGEATVADLRAVGDLVRQYRTVDAAREHLAGRYGVHHSVAAVARAVADLQDALAALTADSDAAAVAG